MASSKIDKRVLDRMMSGLRRVELAVFPLLDGKNQVPEMPMEAEL